MNYYEDFVDLKINRSTMKADFDTLDLLHGVLGLVGEAGEVADLVKKHMFQGHDLDKGKMVEELGDTLFYLVHVLNSLDVVLVDCASANMDKLNCRYQGTASTNESVNRDKAKEQKIFDRWRD